MADDEGDSRRGSSTYGVVFWDFVDRVWDLAEAREITGFCAAGTLQLLANNSPLTEKLAPATVAIDVKGAKLCKYLTKLSRKHFTFTWYYHHVSVIK